MEDDKTLLLKQLDEVRDHLWTLLEGVEPSWEIYPGWNKRDFFAHIAGWDAMMFEIFRDFTVGHPGKARPYSNADDFNRYFIERRQSATVEGARLECEINRFAINTLLQGIPSENYQQTIQFPWGPNTVAEFIIGAIEHERDHANDIRKLVATIRTEYE